MTDNDSTKDKGEKIPLNDSEGTSKTNGLGDGDGTIPNHPGGIAVGHTGNSSAFEPEEDEHVN